MVIRNYTELKKAVGTLPPVTVAVAAAADPEVIGGLKLAHDMGFIGTCIVTGDPKAIEKCIAEAGDDIKKYEIVAAKDDGSAGRLAVRAVREQGAKILVKGSLKSELYLKAILDKEQGIKASAVLSNISLFEMPSYHKFLGVTDNAIIVAPTIEEKRAIIENTRPLFKALGVDKPKVALLAAVETVSPKQPATQDAAALVVMAMRGQIKDFIVDGPLGYDAAISAEAAATKGIKNSPVCGDPDLIVAPNLETANSLGKSYKFHGSATWGGLVLGALVPAVLNSRSDDEQNRLNALLLARAMAAL
ncbi:MAG TPA: phosphate acyltransferase [bacterium]|nr:phosphate acyltransferase [bacterium]